jgi:transposase
MPEITRLARTSRHWWPAIPVALITQAVSNARTEGFNRVIQQTMRVDCGYRNMINYQRRILSHTVITRPQRSAA